MVKTRFKKGAKVFDIVKNEAMAQDGSSFFKIGSDSWKVSGELNSYMELPNVNKKADRTKLTFSIAYDHVNNKSDYAFCWAQNGRNMVDLTMKQSWEAETGLANFDLSQFNSMSSILDILAAFMTSRKLDEGKITLLDDLTTTVSISDLPKALELARATASARRNYGDEATIDHYTQQLNQLIKAEMTCKGVGQTIPMQLVTTKFGVDWWTMPAFKFADENGYIPFTELLDAETVTYGFNIIDHAVEPMQQSVVVVRQLLEYVNTLFRAYEIPKGQE